jgi:hypothetical protein
MKYHETDLYGTLLEELSHKGASAVIASLGYDVPAGKGKHNERSLAVLAKVKAMSANELNAWVAEKTEKRRATNPLTMTPEEFQAYADKRQQEWNEMWEGLTEKGKSRYMKKAAQVAANIERQEHTRHHSQHTV